MFSRSGKRLKVEPRRGLQLANMTREADSDEDVNGNPLSEDAKNKRIAALALCLAQRDALENGSASRKGEMIAGAIKLCDRLGVWSNEVDVKEEAFICITCSGLLLLCVDVALKAIEDWCIDTSKEIVTSAGRLLALGCLDGAEGVTYSNKIRCSEFVRRNMPDHHLPCEFEEEHDKIFKRWKWYLMAKGKSTTYFERYVVESIKDDVLTKVEEVCKHSVPAGVEVVDKLIKALETIRASLNE